MEIKNKERVVCGYDTKYVYSLVCGKCGAKTQTDAIHEKDIIFVLGIPCKTCEQFATIVVPEVEVKPKISKYIPPKFVPKSKKKKR